MKELGAEWKRLDAATKARYADVATADKARFEKENGVYQAALQAEEILKEFHNFDIVVPYTDFL